MIRGAAPVASTSKDSRYVDGLKDGLSPGIKPVVGDRLHVVKCNHCKSPVLFEHRAWHSIECRKRRNAKKLDAMNLSKDGKALYAIAAARKRKGQWRAPEIHYAHGETPSHAKHQFLSGETDPIHVISIGLAIGWFEHESGLITGS
jgi:hypothetical protein